MKAFSRLCLERGITVLIYHRTEAIIRHVATFSEQKECYLKQTLCCVIKVKINCCGQHRANALLKTGLGASRSLSSLHALRQDEAMLKS